ncbi:MAG: hydrogenase maturation protease [Chloroflexota bacterium]
MNRANHENADILCVGVGNEFRHDDAVGLIVTRHLRALDLPNMTIIEASGEGAGLLEAWEGYRHIILIDATSSGASPGTIHRIDAHTTPIPLDLFSYSSHAFGVAQAVEMARAIGRLPAIVQVFGIEGQNFSMGCGLTDSVEMAGSDVVDAVAEIHYKVTQRSIG